MENRPEDRDNVPCLSDLYRLQYVDRWHIVRTERRQSVADHSLMVALIAGRVAQAIGLDPARVVAYAVIHDALECYTGDIPSPVKDYVRNADLENMLPRFDTPDMLTKDVVKFADLAESVKFLTCWGDNGHGTKILAKLITNMWEHWGEMMEEYGEKFDWHRGQDLIVDFMQGEETFIDDYV